MKKASSICVLSLVLGVSMILAGCSSQVDSSSGGTTTTIGKSVTTAEATTTTVAPTTTTAPTPTKNPEVIAYQLDRELGAAPDCSNPAADRGAGHPIEEMTASADGKWRLGDGCKMDDTLLVNCTGTDYAIYADAELGKDWKVGASFRPVQNNKDAAEPVCSRMWITNKEGENLFLLTVNNIRGQAVEVFAEVQNKGSWLKLYTSNAWLETSSDVFYMELSREKDTNTLRIRVLDENGGEIVNELTPKIRWEEILNAATYGGLGVYNSATEYFYWSFQ